MPFATRTISFGVLLRGMVCPYTLFMRSLTARSLRAGIAAGVAALFLALPLACAGDGDHALTCASIAHGRTLTAPAKIKIKPLALDAGARAVAVAGDLELSRTARAACVDQSPRACALDRSPESRRGPPAILLA